ncbi:hypothetical protein DFH08DRAFT_1040734 [Mycena albidolilacea]|uniref:DUF6534 domain-containing protein n=1 Tax=Mycena albidolilacea TaxID=1033008 RepID=A0AAD6ZBK2_9AGAR|nr:hypothetical protein DFH08DRAFT_1040734 [Mycena albidolilacea]
MLCKVTYNDRVGIGGGCKLRLNFALASVFLQASLYDMNLPAEVELGPWLIGLSIELVLQGVLSTQASVALAFVKYFETYRHSDPLGLKVYVGGLALLTWAISIFTFAIVWYLFAVHFGEFLGGEAGSTANWLGGSSTVVRAAAGLYVQAYFCERLLLLSKKWYIVAPMGLIFVTAFASNVTAVSYYISKGIERIDLAEQWFNIQLPLTMAGDVLLTTTTAYFLIKCKKDVLPQSVGIINALIRLTFQTAAPATIVAFGNFVFSVRFPDMYPGGRSSAAMAWNMVLPKLYAFSMMWTLNARHRMRTELNSSGTSAFTAANPSQHTVVGDAELGIADGKVKMSTESYAARRSKSYIRGASGKPRAHVAEEDSAAVDAMDREGSEELVFAGPRNASTSKQAYGVDGSAKSGSEDGEGSGELMFAHPGNAAR